MKSPLVSIIIPVYNNEKTLEQTIKSALSQSYKNTEIIIIDDNSSDSSAQIYNKYKPVIRIESNNRNLGLYNCRINSLSYAKGSYIAFVDADDWLDSDAIKSAIETALDLNADITQMRVTRRVTKWNIPIGYNNKYEDTQALESCLYNDKLFPVSCWGKLYSLSLLNEIEFPQFNQFWGEDRIFNLNAIYKASKIAISENSIYNYRWGGLSYTRLELNDLELYKNVFLIKSAWAIKNNYHNKIHLIQSELISLLEYHLRRLLDSNRFSDNEILNFISSELNNEFWADFKIDNAHYLFNRNKYSLSRKFKRIIKVVL